MTNIDELLAVLKRAEQREREANREAAAEALGDLFERDRSRQLEGFRRNSDSKRDELRSESDKLRHQDLELQRQLLGELDPADEAERQDLASRRTDSGYYKPSTGDEDAA